MAYDRAVEVLFCGRCSGRDVDKLATAGLTPVDAQAVNVPAIGEALAHVECEVEAEYPAGDHVIVVGRVVAASAEQGVLVDGHFDIGHWSLPVGHCQVALVNMTGAWYNDDTVGMTGFDGEG